MKVYWLFFLCIALAAVDPCFTQEEVNGFLAQMNQSHVIRDSMIIVEEDPWETHELGAYIAAIVLQEIMNYTIQMNNNITNGTNGALERLSEGISDINLEVWDEGQTNSPEYDEYVIENATVVDCGYLGTLGKHGLYVPSYMYSLYNYTRIAVDFWRSYNYSDAYDILRSELVNSSLEMYEPFIPPWCENSEKPCVQLLATEPTWSMGVLPQIVRNLNWNMTVLYLGNYTQLNSVVMDKMNKMEPVIFLQTYPCQFVADYSPYRVMLPLYDFVLF